MDKKNGNKLPGKYKSVFDSSNNNNNKNSNNIKKINNSLLPTNDLITNDISIDKKQHKRKKVRSKRKFVSLLSCLDTH